MRFQVLFFCILLGIWCIACGTVSVRPVYEYSEVDLEFDGEVLIGSLFGNYYRNVDYDKEIKSSRWGVELAFSVNPNIECFVDVNHVRAEYFKYDEYFIFKEEFFDTWDVDGEELGIGVRSLWSHVPGWGLDWGARLKYQELDDTDSFYSTTEKLKIKNYGIDLNIGPYYTIPLEKDYFLSPQGGLLIRVERGNMKQEYMGWDRADLDYDQDSVALYFGFRLNAENLKDLTLQVNGYTGTDSLRGYFLSIGCRF